MRLIDYIEALRPFYPGLGQDRRWSGTTRAADVQYCPRLEEWPGFWAEVHGILGECSGVEFRALKHPKLTKQAAKLNEQAPQPLLSEFDVSNLLNNTIGRPVKDILLSVYRIDATFDDPRSAVPIGDPNRVLCATDIPVQQLKANEPPMTRNKPLVAVEVKPPWVLSLPPNVMTIFNRERQLILSQQRRGQLELVRAISQMFAHMHVNDLTYAVLTTYHSSYFFRRIDEKGNFPRLQVSPIIRRNDIGENSLVAAFVGAAVVAFREGRWVEALGPPVPSFRILDANPGTTHRSMGVDGPGTNLRDREVGMAARYQAGHPNRIYVQFSEFISRNLASTYRGVLQVGQVRRDVIFKIYDLSIVEYAEVCRDELKAYAALTPIQGTHVPRIWAVGTLYGIYRVIAMQPCGNPVPEPPPPEFYEKAPELFRAIHDLSVVHGDIDLRNFMVSHGHHYWVIDFNSAKIGTPAQIRSEERYLGTLLQKMKSGYIYPKAPKDEGPENEDEQKQQDGVQKGQDEHLNEQGGNLKLISKL